MAKAFEIRLDIKGGSRDEAVTTYAEFSIEADNNSSTANLYVRIREFLTSAEGKRVLFPYSTLVAPHSPNTTRTMRPPPRETGVR